MGANEHPPGSIHSDFTLFDIIEGLKELEQAGVTQLADHLGYSKSSIHKHLKSLEERGYVTATDGVYELSLRWLEVGGFVRDHSRIYRFGRPYAEKLASETDEMVILTARDYHHGVFLFRTNNRYGLQNLIPMGNRFYLHQNAAGRAMLAESSDPEIEEFIRETGLPKAMEKTITDPSELYERIEEIRDQGIAVSRDERFEGIRAVSAAIVDENTDTYGGVSIVAPHDESLADSFESEHAEAVIHTAREISLQLKYDEPDIGVPH